MRSIEQIQQWADWASNHDAAEECVLNMMHALLDETTRLQTELAAKSDAYRDNIATWMTKYGDKAAECHRLKTALERIRDEYPLPLVTAKFIAREALDKEAK